MTDRRRLRVSSAVAATGAVAVPLGWWVTGPTGAIFVFVVWAVVALTSVVLAYRLGRAAITAQCEIEVSAPALSLHVGRPEPQTPQDDE